LASLNYAVLALGDSSYQKLVPFLVKA